MKQGNIFEKRMENVAEKGDPLAVAIVAYQIIRESPLFNEFKDKKDKEKMNEVVIDSIVTVGKILESFYKWEDEKIKEFFKHIQGLVKGL